MKRFKEWLTNKWPKSKPKRLISLAERVELKQNFYSLDDDRFLNVRIADKEDVSDILEIEKKCYDGQTPWNRSALMHEIQYNKNAFYLIVHDLHKPVAFVGSWFTRQEAHITNIATIPTYERQGIATFLIQQLVEVGKEEGMDILSLECRVSNKNAQSLYRKLGFKDGRIKKGYYANDHEDALEMAMDLKEAVELRKECEGDVSASNR